MRASFAAIVSNFSRLELLDARTTWHPTFVLRGIQALPMRLVP
jgi:hypothetical protein